MLSLSLIVLSPGHDEARAKHACQKRCTQEKSVLVRTVLVFTDEQLSCCCLLKYVLLAI
jgi:hypothetical protein